MISVVIRNKNQATALNFLLQLLFTRYKTDIDEVIVLDNLSNDESAIISNKHGARLVSVHDFSYGGSANLAAQEARNQIVVIMSAHSFPVSHDFFQLITKKFVGRETKLAGVRCLHNYGDYISFFNNLNAKDDYNRAGLIFACSAFNKNIWQQHPFKADITTFEDKEWTKRVLAYGYEIDFVESIFCYNIKRSKKQNFFRNKNEIIGSYQLHHINYNFYNTLKHFIYCIYQILKTTIIDIYYAFRLFLFTAKFILNKPDRF